MFLNHVAIQVGDRQKGFITEFTHYSPHSAAVRRGAVGGRGSLQDSGSRTRSIGQLLGRLIANEIVVMNLKRTPLVRSSSLRLIGNECGGEGVVVMTIVSGPWCYWRRRIFKEERIQLRCHLQISLWHYLPPRRPLLRTQSTNRRSLVYQSHGGRQVHAPNCFVDPLNGKDHPTNELVIRDRHLVLQPNDIIRVLDELEQRPKDAVVQMVVVGVLQHESFQTESAFPLSKHFRVINLDAAHLMLIELGHVVLDEGCLLVVEEPL